MKTHKFKSLLLVSVMCLAFSAFSAEEETQGPSASRLPTPPPSAATATFHPIVPVSSTRPVFGSPPPPPAPPAPAPSLFSGLGLSVPAGFSPPSGAAFPYPPVEGSARPTPPPSPGAALRPSPVLTGEQSDQLLDLLTFLGRAADTEASKIATSERTLERAIQQLRALCPTSMPLRKPLSDTVRNSLASIVSQLCDSMDLCPQTPQGDALVFRALNGLREVFNISNLYSIVLSTSFRNSLRRRGLTGSDTQMETYFIDALILSTYQVGYLSGQPLSLLPDIRTLFKGKKKREKSFLAAHAFLYSQGEEKRRIEFDAQLVPEHLKPIVQYGALTSDISRNPTARAYWALHQFLSAPENRDTVLFYLSDSGISKRQHLLSMAATMADPVPEAQALQAVEDHLRRKGAKPSAAHIDLFKVQVREESFLASALYIAYFQTVDEKPDRETMLQAFKITKGQKPYGASWSRQFARYVLSLDETNPTLLKEALDAINHSAPDPVVASALLEHAAQIKSKLSIVPTQKSLKALRAVQSRSLEDLNSFLATQGETVLTPGILGELHKRLLREPKEIAAYDTCALTAAEVCTGRGLWPLATNMLSLVQAQEGAVALHLRGRVMLATAPDRESYPYSYANRCREVAVLFQRAHSLGSLTSSFFLMDFYQRGIGGEDTWNALHYEEAQLRTVRTIPSDDVRAVLGMPVDTLVALGIPRFQHTADGRHHVLRAAAYLEFLSRLFQEAQQQVMEDAKRTLRVSEAYMTSERALSSLAGIDPGALERLLAGFGFARLDRMERSRPAPLADPGTSVTSSRVPPPPSRVTPTRISPAQRLTPPPSPPPAPLPPPRQAQIQLEERVREQARGLDEVAQRQWLTVRAAIEADPTNPGHHHKILRTRLAEQAVHSCRLNGEDRVIYTITEKDGVRVVDIRQIGGHYDD